MDIKTLTAPAQLERYSFLWSIARLVIASIALFAGGVPVLRLLFPSYALIGVVRSVLNVTWLVSGLASVYLLYLWNKSGQVVFGGKDNKDVAAFFISVVSGINLGLVPLLNRNIGMSIVANRFIWLLAGVAYLWTAYHLFTRWKASGEKVFKK